MGTSITTTGIVLTERVGDDHPIKMSRLWCPWEAGSNADRILRGAISEHRRTA
ncbi:MULTISPECIES: hypothetical protein [Nonomuraea]|uniref:Uncharacterized protein n=1 Tax=Nonomuraea mangrovi TaxID=2316207 RepID=A0ABW4T7K3_9ACTN